MNEKKIPILLAAVLFLYVSISTFTVYGQTKDALDLNAVLSDYTIRFQEGGSYPVQKNFKYTSKKKFFHTIVAQENDTRIEIEIFRLFTEEEAVNHTKAKYAIVKNLYGPQKIPYNGTLTVTTECPIEYKPKEITVYVLGKATQLLIANATERYVLGVWDEKLIKQKACFFVYCDMRNKVLYQIIIFKPFASFELQEVLNIISGLQKTK
jgi:hypothetical protein